MGRSSATVILLSATALLGCPPTPTSDSPLRELERLAFVPKGVTPRDAAIEVGCAVDLLVDRFEVTRDHWLSVLNLVAGPWGATPNGDFPATHVTLEEARTFAARREMRLPSVDEWLWCAVGPRASAYPYARPQMAIANTRELGLGRPAPVGTFEGGRTPDTGLYDLHGNVRELALSTRGPQPAVAAGGSFDTALSATFGRVPRDFVLADPISGNARLADVGLRCVVPAEEWLRLHGGRLSRAEWRVAVRAVGKRWGSNAAPLLARLVAEGVGSDACRWLLEGAR